MSLYIVHKKNPWVKKNTILRLFDDGFEKVVGEQKDGRFYQRTFTGLIYPYELLRPYVYHIQRGGFDKWHKNDSRGGGMRPGSLIII